MLFNSYIFVFVFLPVTLSVYYWLYSKDQAYSAKCWLLACSLFFYGWWNPIYLVLLLLSIAVNYWLGIWVTQRGKGYLVFGVLFNLALLGFFKYANFFVDTVNAIGKTDFNLQTIVLPLAISFFTFQQISYLRDCYRKKVCERNIVYYSLFVSFFPQLIAGPIVHHREIIDQYKANPGESNRMENIVIGLFVFTFGLFKKTILADHLGDYVDPVYADTSEELSVTTELAWFATLAYTLQLYFDFSGYCDMALGLALMFGIKLPINFNSPYLAKNMFELWQRWHITLTRFMREHVYYPLCRNRWIPLSTLGSLVVTIVLSGLWHGANWTFVIWGTIHAVLLLLNYAWRQFRRFRGHNLSHTTVPGLIVSIALTFFVGMFTRLFFRSDSIDSAWLMMNSMVYNTVSIDPPLSVNTIDYCVLAVVMAIVFLTPTTQQWFRYYNIGLDVAKNRHMPARLLIKFNPQVRINTFWIAIFSILFVTSLIGISKTTEFIYFQF